MKSGERLKAKGDKGGQKARGDEDRHRGQHIRLVRAGQHTITKQGVRGLQRFFTMPHERYKRMILCCNRAKVRRKALGAAALSASAGQSHRMGGRDVDLIMKMDY